MCQDVRTSDRQFVRRCQVAGGFFLLLYVASSQTALRMAHGPLTIPLAGLAGAGIFGEMVSVGLLILRKQDEFQRILLIRSFSWATVISMGLATVWGTVELFSRRIVPHLDVLWIPLVLLGITAMAKLVIFRQHRAAGE